MTDKDRALHEAAESERTRVGKLAKPGGMYEWPAFIVPRCECSHATGDHTHTQTGGIAVLRGACMVTGCECREFRERGAEAA